MSRETRARNVPLFGIVTCIFFVAACDREPQEGVDAAVDIESHDIALNNRGVALMGQFDYAAAREAFATLAERLPSSNPVRLNLAIATLNRQEPGDDAAAMALVQEVLAVDPENLRAHYIAGMLGLYAGESDAALAHLLKVAEQDDDDAYAAYYVAQSLLQSGRVEETLPWYERAIERDAYLRSAYYGAALALRRLGRADEARAMLEQYERFKDNPRARLAEFKYTRMGPKAEALAVGDPDAPTPEPVEGPLFQAPQHISDTLVAGSGAALTTVDIDADGHQDLFLTPGGNEQAGALLLGRGGADFAQAADHPLEATTRVAAALWGDIDNDGLVDVYLCRRGPNQLWRQHAPGEWRDVTAASGTGNGDRNCAAGAMFDADHDGDLDIFVVNEDGPDELYNNNLDGSFRALADAQGLAGPGSGGRGVVVADLDRDRDADILVIRSQPPHDVYLNDRLWQYREAPAFAAFRDTPAQAAVAGDVDGDGSIEIYTVDHAGALRRWRHEAGGLKSEVLARISPGEPPALGLQDFDGDGISDLLASRHEGFVVFEIGTDGAHAVFEESGSIAALIPVLIEPRGGPALVGLERDTE
ncbi:MAG: FG-GAP-like repeat-containing protein, partial [Gammaproteobacteria bacterium]